MAGAHWEQVPSHRSFCQQQGETEAQLVQSVPQRWEETELGLCNSECTAPTQLGHSELVLPPVPQFPHIPTTLV